MKTYEEYKVSGVKWLGKVPKHWEICRFKDFISLQTQTSLSENKIGLENIECATGKFIETNSEFEGNGIAFDVGDVIYGKLRPYLKKVWLSTFNGNAVGDFFVFRAKNTNSASYIRYVMLSDGFTKEADGSTFGTKMPRVSSNFIMSMRYFLPPPFEQQAIADYLDAKTEKMDQMIAKAEKKIEYLDELKQSLITRAVTRGLNPNTPLKDSGVNWIGNIPMHWDIACLRFFLRLINGRAYSQNELLPSGKYKVLRVGNFFTNDSWYYSNMELEPDKYCDKDDLLYAWSASVGPYIWNEAKTIYHYHIWKVQLATSMDKMYSYYLLRAVTNQKMSDMHGSTMMHITMGDMNKTKIPIPPLSEQQQIATYLDTKCSKIDHIIATQKKKIAYLQELKQSLITNVVTGKIKVS